MILDDVEFKELVDSFEPASCQIENNSVKSREVAKKALDLVKKQERKIERIPEPIYSETFPFRIVGYRLKKKQNNG